MAGMIGEEDIQKVRDATDLIQLASERVQLRQRSNLYWCCCPVHQEKTPSCKLDPSTQLWHCFGCHAGGDVFGWVMQTEDLTFPDAVRRLAERANIELQETKGKKGPSHDELDRLRQVCDESARFFHMQLMRSRSSDAQAARSYLAGRSLGGEVPKTWNLGFAPGSGSLVRHLREKGFTNAEMVQANVATDKNGRINDRFYNRVMFPIRDADGRTIAFGGRVIGQGEPKYLNSNENPIFHKGSVLYGIDLAKGPIAACGVAIVVEGYTDVIALHEAGVKNVVATLGTALTIRHIRTLSRHAKKRIVYLFDGDEAGQRAADRALGFIDDSMTPEAGRMKIDLCAVTLPGGLDPADFVAKNGGKALQDLIDTAKPLIEFGIERRLAGYDLSRAEDRVRAMLSALSILAPIKDSLMAKEYAARIAQLTGTRQEDAIERLAKLKPQRAAGTDEASETETAEPTAESRIQLPASEIDRRKFERELVQMLIANPVDAIRYAERISRIDWHAVSTMQAATFLLEALLDDPGLSSDAAKEKLQEAFPAAAAAILKHPSTNASPKYLAYVLDELEIGDLETLIASKKSLVGEAGDSAGTAYEDVVELRSQLAEKRRVHQL